MKKVIKLLCLAMALTMLLTTLAGCGKDTSAEQSAASSGQSAASSASADNSAAKLQEVPVTIYVAGDRPKQQDEVLEAINNATKEELNINLKVNYIPWGDYVSQVKLKASAGEEFDIFLSFFGELSGNIARKQCISINDLLDKYGAALKQQIPQNLWDSLTVDGKIYGIPAVYAMTEMGRGFLVRKDLREKYNLPEITSLATYEQFLDTIAKNEPDVIPCLGGDLSSAVVCDAGKIGHSIFTFGGDNMSYLYVDQDKRPLKVENYVETDLFKEIWKEDIKAYNNGWFEKDFLSDKDRDGKFIAGKAASMGGDLYNINDRENQLKKNVPNGEVELAIINKGGKWINIGPVNNFGMISSTSKNPDRAVMFMNRLRKDQKNYDMYMLGIEGKTYKLNGEKAEVPEGTDPKDRYNPTPWFTMHFPYLRTWTTDSPAYTQALDFWNSLKPETAPLSTFSYSSENVKAEKAAVEKVMTDEVIPLFFGAKQKDEDYDKVVKNLKAAGIQKILDDTQKQIDDFVAKNNIK